MNQDIIKFYHSVIGQKIQKNKKWRQSSLRICLQYENNSKWMTKKDLKNWLDKNKKNLDKY